MKIRMSWVDNKGSEHVIEGEGDVSFEIDFQTEDVYEFASYTPVASYQKLPTGVFHSELTSWEMSITPAVLIREDPLP